MSLANMCNELLMRHELLNDVANSLGKIVGKGKTDYCYNMIDLSFGMVKRPIEVIKMVWAVVHIYMIVHIYSYT